MCYMHVERPVWRFLPVLRLDWGKDLTWFEPGGRMSGCGGGYGYVRLS